jgi:hypothetical protein
MPTHQLLPKVGAPSLPRFLMQQRRLLLFEIPLQL